MINSEMAISVGEDKKNECIIINIYHIDNGSLSSDVPYWYLKIPKIIMDAEKVECILIGKYKAKFHFKFYLPIRNIMTYFDCFLITHEALDEILEWLEPYKIMSKLVGD